MTGRDPAFVVGVRGLAVRGRLPDAAAVAEVVGDTTVGLSMGTRESAARGLLDECVGLGPLAAIVAVEGVTDVLVDADGSVWVDDGEGLRGAGDVGGGSGGGGIDVGGGAGVRRLAVRLAGLAGRRLDDSQPWVDGQLPGGIRLHAVLPPIAADGAHISLRIPSRRPWTLSRLVAAGACEGSTADLLGDLVRARRTILVSGATGAGKTALLAALIGEVPADERIVVVEDVREIRTPRPRVVSLQGRSANVEGVGQVSMSDLIRQALRMRADRLVVGEARGPEVVDLLTALNTGHAGLGTIHANSAVDVTARCVALGGLAGQSPEAVLRQFATAVDVVVHVARRAGTRRVAEVAVVEDGHVVPALTCTGSAPAGWSGARSRPARPAQGGRGCAVTARPESAPRVARSGPAGRDHHDGPAFGGPS